MKIKDLEIGKVYYVSDGLLSIKTSPRLLLLDKGDTQYLFEVCFLGVSTKRTMGEVFWKDLSELSRLEGHLVEYDEPQQYISGLV